MSRLNARYPRFPAMRANFDMKIGKIDHGPHTVTLEESVFFSYGFRPFFLGAALFAGLAIPVLIVMLTGDGHSATLLAARNRHVHEMVFGFLPAVITGFLLRAIPHWTDRPPIQGHALMLLFGLWLAGRLLGPWPHSRRRSRCSSMEVSSSL